MESHEHSEYYTEQIGHNLTVKNLPNLRRKKELKSSKGLLMHFQNCFQMERWIFKKKKKKAIGAELFSGGK